MAFGAGATAYRHSNQAISQHQARTGQPPGRAAGGIRPPSSLGHSSLDNRRMPASLALLWCANGGSAALTREIRQLRSLSCRHVHRLQASVCRPGSVLDGHVRWPACRPLLSQGGLGLIEAHLRAGQSIARPRWLKPADLRPRVVDLLLHGSDHCPHCGSGGRRRGGSQLMGIVDGWPLMGILRNGRAEAGRLAAGHRAVDLTSRTGLVRVRDGMMDLAAAPGGLEFTSGVASRFRPT